MGRLKLIIKQGSNFSIELYSDNLNNSLLILQAKDSSGAVFRHRIYTFYTFILTNTKNNEQKKFADQSQICNMEAV